MPRLLLAVVCDDVRIEAGHKHSLMGLFDTFNVADFAQPLPVFHVFARVALDDGAAHDVVMYVRSDAGDFQIQVPVRVQAHGRDEASGHYVATLNVALNGIRVPRPATYHIGFTVGGSELGGPSLVVRASQRPTLQ